MPVAPAGNASTMQRATGRLDRTRSRSSTLVRRVAVSLRDDVGVWVSSSSGRSRRRGRSDHEGHGDLTQFGVAPATTATDGDHGVGADDLFHLAGRTFSPPRLMTSSVRASR